MNAELTTLTELYKKLGMSDKEIADNIVIWREWLGSIKDLNKQLSIQQQYVDLLESSLTSAMTQMSSAIVSNLLDGENAFKDFGDLALSIIEQIITQLLQLAVIQPIVQGIMSSLGFTASVAKTTSGSGTPPVAMAKGGVVTSPTYFKFAQGTGLMGEEGWEGILPLARNHNGDLGVAAIGNIQRSAGSSSVVINVTNKGEAVVVESQQQRQGTNGETIIDLVIAGAINRLEGKGQLDALFVNHGGARRGKR